MTWLQAAAVVLLGTGAAQAEADLSTFRPMPRPAAVTGVAAQGPIRPTIRPMPRPKLDVESEALPHIRPMPRPPLLASAPVVPPVDPALQPAVVPPVSPVVTPQKPVKASLKGSVCQQPQIKGKTLAPIRSVVAGCNVPDAVLVSQVAGVALNPPATINCEEAKALSVWVKGGLEPAFANSIVALNVVDSYACRPRNNVRGAPVSVHGLGQAIDIAGFVTNTGRTYTVAQNYNAQIRAAEKSGCGTFHTILGPGSDGYHENHIHFDVSHHGGSDYCH